VTSSDLQAAPEALPKFLASGFTVVNAAKLGGASNLVAKVNGYINSAVSTKASAIRLPPPDSGPGLFDGITRFFVSPLLQEIK
jgi:hypothetical protein